MRHRQSGRKFGMDSTARKAMFRNMVTSLMLHGQIRTTLQRAKELRRVADRVITIGKVAPSSAAIEGLQGSEKQVAVAARVNAIRRAKLWVNDDEALKKLFGEYAERFRVRPGGYTRIVKAGWRPGDMASMAIIQLVGPYYSETGKAEVASESAAPVEGAPPATNGSAAQPASETPVADQETPPAAP